MGEISGAQWLNAGSQVLSAAVRPSAAAPSYAQSGVSVNAPDFGGFNVNFGAGSVSASGNSTLILAAIAAGVLLVALVWIKKQ